MSNIKAADARNKYYYDKRNNRQQVLLKHGDFVLVRTPRVTKLGRPARGPF